MAGKELVVKKAVPAPQAARDVAMGVLAAMEATNPSIEDGCLGLAMALAAVAKTVPLKEERVVELIGVAWEAAKSINS